MRTPRTFLPLASTLALTLLGACDPGLNLDVRTFQLQHRSGYEASELIAPYVFTDRAGNPGQWSATPDAISIRESPDNLEKIARVLEEFDVPLPGLRLRFQLIEADSFQDQDPAIAHVVGQLQEIFRFQGYRLLGEAVIQVTGEAGREQGASQRFLGTEESFQVEVRSQLQRSGSVRLGTIALWYGDEDRILETSVTVNAGQTVVIGGAKARQGSRSFILTVTAEAD